MKYLGWFLIAAGLAFLAFSLYIFIKDKNRFHSPVPYNNEVKVIIITPSK